MPRGAAVSVSAATIPDQLADVAARQPDRPALEDTAGERLTYGTLAEQVENVARSLAAAGMAKGDRVLFSVRPSLAAIVLILATARAGGVLVAFDLGMGPALFASRMALLRPRWVMAESVVYALSALAPARRLFRLRGLTLPDLGRLPGARFVRVGRRLPGVPPSYELADLARATPAGAPAFPDPEGADPILVVFTSGTTAAPKAVVHTNRSIAASMAVIASSLAIGPADVAYSDKLHLILPALLAGARVVIPRYRRFLAARTLRDLVRYGATQTFGVPSEFQQLLELAARHHIRLPASLRAIFLGAAPVHGGFLARLRETVDVRTRVWCVYGMTEMLPVCRVDLEEKLAYDGPGDLVGAPFTGVRVDLAEDGELIVAGPHLFDHYWGEPSIARHPTGDLATLDPAGRVVLLGRKKDMIIRGQTNIYPALVESIVARVPGVRGCCLVGLYLEDLNDEEVVLVVEPEPGTELPALERRLWREMSGGAHPIDTGALPDRVAFQTLPLVGRSRKVDRPALRARLAAAAEG
jgi:acyl-CoA synthetase (AMP-forming)/AMP-acid ligase II